MVMSKLNDIERKIATKLASLLPTSAQPNSSTDHTPSLSQPASPDQLLSGSSLNFIQSADQLTSLTPPSPSGSGKEMQVSYHHSFH